MEKCPDQWTDFSIPKWEFDPDLSTSPAMNCHEVRSLESQLVVWNFVNFHSVGNGMSSSQLTNSIIFPKGRYTTHQKVSWEGLNPFGPSISSARSKKMVDLCTPRRRLQVSATGLLVFSLVRPKPGEALQF